MSECTELWPKKKLATKLWLSPSARKGLEKHADGDFLSKLERWLTNGLWNYVGPDFPLKSQGKSVYRLATRASRLRILVFFENGQFRDDFIVPIAKKKSGTKTPQEWIEEVARVRVRGDWTKHDRGQPE